MNRLSRSLTGIVMLTGVAGIWSEGASSMVLPESMALSDDGTQLLQRRNAASGLYDETVLRTIHLEFKQEDWWQQLQANYGTGVDIPADLTMDGITYSDVGVHFRGMTSYMMTGNSQKKSFNISMDYTDPDQRLMGYRTLNLNNGHLDPSFMREVLYFNLCRNYIPSPKASFAKLVINGENWGIYDSAQQNNADLVEEWFLSNDGDRWKADMGDMGGGQGTLPGGQRTPQTRWPTGGGGMGGGMFGGGDKALTWLGSDVAAYESAYDLKAANTPDPWENLIAACDVLNNTPLEQLADTVGSVLAVDRWLWFLAVENVLTDEDSYLTKGADYEIYYEVETGRIHPLQHDGNETFIVRDVRRSPVEGEGNANRPVISRLLSIPALRQRYLAHVRTIVNESLDWSILAPKIEAYRALIEDEVTADTKKLYSYANFETSLADFRTFVEGRREYLLSYPEINRPAPEIHSVVRKTVSEGRDAPLAGEALHIAAEVGGSVGIGEVTLHYAERLVGPFDHVPMLDDGAHGDGEAGDGIFVGEIPPFPVGSMVRYYVEARASDEVGTTTFAPPGAEHDVFVYKVSIAIADSTPLVINELMAANDSTVQDPQGEYDDWIELLNLSDQEVDLSGMYLTDRQDDLRKWAFPEGTMLAPRAYLMIWADEDGGDEPGLHANFRLSGSGEVVLLVDADERGNALLDSVTFGEQETDVSFGRSPDGTGLFGFLSFPTPGAANSSIMTGVSEGAPATQPQRFSLEQNMPNPFNSDTVIRFTLPESAEIDLGMYNLLGQRVATLAHGMHPAGTYRMAWDGRSYAGEELASGVYLYRLNAGMQVETRRLVLLR